VATQRASGQNCSNILKNRHITGGFVQAVDQRNAWHLLLLLML